MGSHLAAALLRRGCPLILLARSRDGVSAHQRVHDRLAWLGLRPSGEVTVLEGSLDGPDLGLDAPAREILRSRVERVLHCAADTAFARRHRERSERINVEVPCRLLDLLEGGRCRRFHHMSTAYAAGRREGMIPETMERPGSFHNVYEETKWRAEQEIHARCSAAGVALTVHRPSVIYGDSRTGRCLQFHGLYYPVRTLLHLRDILLQDLQAGNGARARSYGVSLDEEKRLLMPVRFESRPSGAINLIPIDHLVRSVCALLDREDATGVFHIVSPSPCSLSLLLRYVQERYPVRGLSTAEAETFEKAPRTSLERLMDKYLSLYNDYMQDLRCFDDRRARPVLESAGLSCPELTFESFDRCMAFAESVEWGRAL